MSSSTLPESLSSGSDEEPRSEEEREDEGGSAFRKAKGGGVTFGSVRVRTHKLTLGDNPGGTTGGVPLAMEWKPENSTRFQNIDEYAINEHGVRDSFVIHEKAKRLAPNERQQIAARSHTSGSIRRIQSEIHEIREYRKKSSTEDIEAAEKADLLKAAKAATKKRGLLKRFFHK